MPVNNNNQTNLEKLKTAGEIDFKVSSMLMVSLNKKYYLREMR